MMSVYTRLNRKVVQKYHTAHGSITILVLALGVLAPRRSNKRRRYDQRTGSARGLKNCPVVTFSGDYTGQRHSPLRQLTPAKCLRTGSAVDVSKRDVPAFRGAVSKIRR